jgi:hypothetical protein
MVERLYFGICLSFNHFAQTEYYSGLSDNAWVYAFLSIGGCVGAVVGAFFYGFAFIA